MTQQRPAHLRYVRHSHFCAECGAVDAKVPGVPDLTGLLVRCEIGKRLVRLALAELKDR